MDNVKEFRFDDVAMDNTLDFKELEVKHAEQVAELKTEEPAPVKEEKPTDGLTEEQKDEYMRIYDAMMFEDMFSKEVKLGKKYSVVFVTRSADADVQIARQLDAMNFQTMAAYQTMAAVLTMSHSLKEFNGKDLTDMTTGARYDFIRNKSSHVIEMLSQHMVDFDILVRKALMYGEVNF